MDKSKQAFPCEAYQDSDAQGYPTLRYPGMTLRDVAAVAAMQGLLANQSYPDRYDGSASDLAITAIEIADALVSRLEEDK